MPSCAIARRFAAALVISSIAPTMLAQPFDYDFSGTLSDHFELAADEPALFSGQSGGVLAFDTGGLTPEGDEVLDVYLHAAFAPRFDESWVGSIDVVLPLALDLAFTPDDSIDQEIAAGIVVVDGVDGSKSFFTGLGTSHGDSPGNGIERHYFTSVGFGEGENGTEVASDSAPAAGVQAATLTLSYNAITHVLTASYGVGDPFPVNIGVGPADFGMNDDDTFSVGVVSVLSNRAIPVAAPVTLDNFHADFNPDPCLPDINGDGFVDNGDIGGFIDKFVVGDLSVDFNGDGLIDNGDIRDFIVLFLAGC